MVRGPRAILIALAVAMPLAACSSFDPENLTDKLDFLDTKKKLAGDRKPVFPNGVPGVQQGVPPELVKGYQAPPEPQTAAAEGQGGQGGQGGAQSSGQTAAQPAAEDGQEPPPKPKRVAAKPKPQPRPQAEPAQEPQAQPQRTAVPQQQPQLAPWPNAPPPATNTAQPAWPSAPAPGTFQR
jgi:hypothetical protein